MQNKSPSVTFEDYDPEALKRANYLKNQLAIVDKAIEKVLGGHDGSDGVSADDTSSFNGSKVIQGRIPTNRDSSTILKSSSVAVLDTDGDKSFRINTAASQLATCPHCYAEMDTKKLKVLNLRQLRKHLDKDCVVAKQRRGLIESAKIRKELELEEQHKAREAEMLRIAEARKHAAEMALLPPAAVTTTATQLTAVITEPELPHVVICPQCKETVKNSQMIQHLKEKCTMRRIMCPNIHAGCDQMLIPLKLLQHHLQHDCRAEKLRDLMIERAKERHEPIQCTACGEFVPIMYMRKHDLERCVNRRVPCRNKGVGCQVMVRLLEKDLHEFVDGKRQMRNALYFNGHGSVMDIAEDDIPCPWTAEFWLYRPTLMECAKSHIRNVLLQLPDYNLRYVGEICIKDQVLHIVNTLKAPPDTSQQAQAQSKVSKEEKTRLAKAAAQERIELVNSLTAMVYVYNDMVLAYMKAFQKLAISIEMGIACVEEIIRTVAFPGSRLTSNLRPIYPGVPPKSKPPTNATNTANNSEGPTAATSAAGSRPGSASTARSNDGSASVGGESYHSGGGMFQEEGDGQNEDDDDDGSVHTQQNEAGGEQPVNENGSQEGGAIATENNEEGGGGAADDPEDIERMLAELDEVTPEEMAAEMARMKKKEDDRLAAEKATEKALDQVKKIHLEAVNSYMEGGNAFAFLYKKGFELQNKQLFDVVQERISQLSLHVESAGANPEVPMNEDHFQHDLDSLLSLLDLQKVGVTNFLLNSICFPKAAMNDKLEWSAWLSLLMAWKHCLIHDLNKLQSFRVNAGLIKPEDSGKKKKHMTAEQEKAILNKEKARKKKELKKRAQLEEQAVEGNTDDEHSVSSHAAGGNKKHTDAKHQLQHHEAESHEKKIQDKLLPRLLELFRGNCGAEALIESSSCSDEHTYSKVCLSLNCGLSVLGREHTLGGENEEEDEELADGMKTPATVTSAAGGGGGGGANEHHYNLLIKPYDLKKMIGGNEHVGIISAKRAAGSRYPSGNSIGTEAQSFDAAVPRGKWSHIALVATATPVNRVTLYLDGLFTKHLNNCSFPLPMSVLGGATTSFSTFEGALLDVRYWNKQRSNVEIMDAMHRLIDISEPGIPKNENAALNDDGLVAWWTFEDGVGGENKVQDVTAHRFKTPITRKPIVSMSYPIPQEVVEILPKAYRWLVDEHQPSSVVMTESEMATASAGTPALASAATTSTFTAAALSHESGSVDGFDTADTRPSTHISDKRSKSAPTSATPLPNQLVMAAMPVSRWLDAEAMPQGYKHVSAAIAANPAAAPSAGSSKSGKSGKHKLGTPSSKAAAAAAGRKRPGETSDKSTAAPGSESSTAAAKKPAAPTMFKDSGTLPIPSFRQRRLCPFEIRRFRLATSGRELQREAECPLGCSIKLRAMEVRFHVKFECVQRMTTCRFDNCEGIFRIFEREQHEVTDCAVLRSRNKILDGYTGNELSICPHCSEPIKNKFMHVHTTAKCVHRLVLCPNIGCSVKLVKAHRLDHHLKFECDSHVAVGRRILIEKARTRLNYPRPWGLQIDVLPLGSADLPIEENEGGELMEDGEEETGEAEGESEGIVDGEPRYEGEEATERQGVEVESDM